MNHEAPSQGGMFADLEQIRLPEQFSGGRVSRAPKLDWMLPNEAFDRAVQEGLRPGNYSYSHSK